jgi:hypothetical protein
MQEAIESGAGQNRVTGKNVSPFGKGLIRSDDGRGVFFVTVANDLEEHGGASLIETEVADFIDDEESWLGEHFHGVGEPVLFEGRAETTRHFQGGEEEEPVSEFGGKDAESDREMSFANSGRTQEQNIAPFGKEAPGGQLLKEGLINRRLEGEVEVFEPLEIRQTGKAQVSLDDALTACGQLGFKQPS